jgi:hypothetical protein
VLVVSCSFFSDDDFDPSTGREGALGAVRAVGAEAVVTEGNLFSFFEIGRFDMLNCGCQQYVR